MSVNITLQIYEKEMTGDAGQHLFWRRYAPFLAQVYPILGAGGVWGGGPAPTQGTEPRFAARVPTLFPHLRQNTFTPAPRMDLTCHSHHVQARLVQRNGLKAQIPCTSLSGKGPKRPIDAIFEHETAL